MNCVAVILACVQLVNADPSIQQGDCPDGQVKAQVCASAVPQTCFDTTGAEVACDQSFFFGAPP